MAQAAVSKEGWGKTASGEDVYLYTLTSSELTVQLTTYGARIVSVAAPDRDGVKGQVVLGYEDLTGYEADHSTYFGAIVGRYGNRIAGGQFTLDGMKHQVPPNNNGNALHGGTVGFDQKVWSAKEVKDGVEMALVSPDGDMGFPGALTVKVLYTLKGSALRIEYAVSTTKATPVNLTNHAYFNLAGYGGVLAHELTIAGDRYTPVDALLIPTGELSSVADTPFDFRKPALIGARIAADFEQLRLGNGYDHNYVLNAPAKGAAKAEHLAAEVYEPITGRTLRVTTTEPGVQLYSGNFLDGKLTGRNGVKYAKHAGFCLETQHYPDSPNRPSFPSTIVRPGKPMHSTTTFVFGVR
jgi:aldose 1-epimerase